MNWFSIGYTDVKYDPLPYICACVMLLLKDDLLACQTDREAETAMLYGCRSLQIDHIQNSFSDRGFQDYLMHQMHEKENLVRR